MDYYLCTIIEKCHLPALKKNFDEQEFHEEYQQRKEAVEKHFPQLLGFLHHTTHGNPKLLAIILILYLELNTEGPWHFETFEKCADQLEKSIRQQLKIDLNNILNRKAKVSNYLALNSDQICSQQVYDECMRELHQKLTSTEFKKYPSLLEVYCKVLDGFQEHEVVSDVKNMPVSLYLIDDHNPACKKKGLFCFKHILEHLPEDAFANGNYYVVIYASLVKLINERDVELTRLTVTCFLLFIEAAKQLHEFQKNMADELYTKVLDQLQTESNLHRKKELFRFMKQLIIMNKENCMNKKVFHTVVCDSLEASTNEGVEEIILLPIIECLEEWIKECWCVWKLKSGQDLPTALLKVLYTCKDESLIARLSAVIGTLITLLHKEERERIKKVLDENLIRNERLNARLQLVTKHINIEKTS